MGVANKTIPDDLIVDKRSVEIYACSSDQVSAVEFF